MVSRTVTRRPFYNAKICQIFTYQTLDLGILHTQSPVAFAISSPTFFGERPRGPILGARADEAPTSPPVALKWLENIHQRDILLCDRFLHLLDVFAFEFRIVGCN